MTKDCNPLNIGKKKTVILGLLPAKLQSGRSVRGP